METKSGKTYALLLFIEGVLVFSLGVFGNKVAERLNISTSLVIVGSILLMCLLLALTILRIKYEKGEEIVPHMPRYIILGTITTIFPIAILLGMVIGFVCLSLLSWERFWIGIISINNYEVFSLFIALVLIFLISSRTRQASIALTFALGLALGLAATFVFLRPDSNILLYTFGGWIIEMFVFALLINSNGFHNLIGSFRNAIQSPQNKNP